MNAPIKKTSTLAIVALVLAFFFPLGGLIVGIIAILKLRNSTTEKGMGIAMIATVGSMIYMVLLAVVMAAIAIPAFTKFQCKSKQAQVKSELLQFQTAQNIYFGEYKRYATTFKELEIFNEEDNVENRYLYEISKADDKGFQITGKGVKSMEGDVWTIDSESVPSAINDRCSADK